MKGLLITYWFPPKASIASHRTYSFYKYLNDKNNSLDVICPDWGNFENKIPGTEIIKTHKVDNKLFDFKKSLFTQIKEWVFYKIFKYNYFRDSKRGAFFNAALISIKNIDLNIYDYIITSYNPLDVIHIGAYIKERYPKIKWIIDYRDYYSLNYYMDFGIFRNKFKKLEKNITKNSDGFVTVSKTLQNGIEKLIRKESVVIYNGFEIFEKEKLSNELERAIEKMPVISYCGSLYNGKRDIENFFQYYKSTGLDLKFKFIFALIDQDDLKLVKNVVTKYNLKNVIIFENLSHQQCVSLMQHSTYLMMFADFSKKSDGFLSGKIFEYMSIQKPVIYSGNTDNYELFELIKKNNLGDDYKKFNYNNAEAIQSSPVEFKRSNQTEKLKTFICKIVENKNE
jgi:glycosyltransferase involved in cell wall biosynthesis